MPKGIFAMLTIRNYRMRKFIFLVLYFIVLPLICFGQKNTWFGCNYTLPFAYAYRAEGYLGLNRKAAIDKDVYHFARLGFNAFRLHLWDVELTDAKGNLKENEHLDLLDYLISRLQQRGIKIILTAQTDFGDGYPEKNIPTGGYSYLYDKCSIHSKPSAVSAEQKYVSALLNHRNKYTGYSYKDDPSILGFEINNEPCHSGTKAETEAYINTMLRAMRKTGCTKPIYYNVSHNRQVVEAYYNTPIQGTTYQWYPVGLVAGHTRTGNFLPYVDEYPIPFSNVKHFKDKMKIVYEFDAADLLYSYMYPAISRTFRTAGFQWITQFTYDPIDLAWSNTEYQTHFMNLAYTPNKAISLKIAGEAARAIPLGKSYGIYPNDTVFGDFRVSYAQDLSEMNSRTKFMYSNDTQTQPKEVSALDEIAGCGSSPVVKYEGTGAYFLDKLDKGVWRLEVMPDAVIVSDPFAKPSLDKEVASILWNAWDMTVNIPDLGQRFNITGINEGNTKQAQTDDGVIHKLRPGVYLLKNRDDNRWSPTSKWKNITLNEFVAPESHVKDFNVINTPVFTTNENEDLTIKATVIGPEMPDSVVIYPSEDSFWNEHNHYIKMFRTHNYKYIGVVPGNEVKGDVFRYTISVYGGGKCKTFPSQADKNPIAWDYYSDNYYQTNVVSPSYPVTISSVTNSNSNIDTYVMPDESKGYVTRKVVRKSPIDEKMIRYDFKGDSAKFYMLKDIDKSRMERIKQSQTICIHIGESTIDSLQVGFVTTDGYTYLGTCKVNDGVVSLDYNKLKLTDTALLPHAYPVFMKRYFHPVKDIPFDKTKIDKLELVISCHGQLTLGSVWLK